MRVLGIDPGERRVGFAVSDPLGLTAQGLETFDAKSGVDLLGFVKDLVERFGVEEIVVGHPLRLSGKAGGASEKAAELADRLRAKLRVDVVLWDERLSSEEAKRVLRGSRARKGSIDKLSAVIILQSYLDYRRRHD